MEPAARRRAVILAGARGDTAAVRRGLSDPDPAVRAGAIRVLVRSTPTADPTAGGDLEPVLTAALDDPAPAVRRTVAEEIGRLGDTPLGRELAPRLVVGLLARLADPDPHVVETAAWACGELGAVQPVADLVAGLDEVARHHPDPLCREAAVAALGALGDPAGLDTVLAGLDDKPAVRRRAVVALAAFDDPRVDEAWERARHDRDRQVREAVEELCG
ncbi:MAG: hypothetical protein D6683_09885, partial [Actinomyces sp.]